MVRSSHFLFQRCAANVCLYLRMVFRKLHKELSGTLHHFLEFEWYAAHFFLDFSGTRHNSFGSQWYATYFMRIAEVRSDIHLYLYGFPFFLRTFLQLYVFFSISGDRPSLKSDSPFPADFATELSGNDVCTRREPFHL